VLPTTPQRPMRVELINVNLFLDTYNANKINVRVTEVRMNDTKRVRDETTKEGYMHGVIMVTCITQEQFNERVRYTTLNTKQTNVVGLPSIICTVDSIVVSKPALQQCKNLP